MSKLKKWFKKRYREMQEYDIDVEQMKKMINEGAMLIDVRSPQEYKEGHINGAISIPNYEIKKRINKIVPNKEQQVIVYCSTGSRSKKVQKELNREGYTQIYNLYNGFET